MFKRIALILTMAVTASFATWDYKSLPKKTTASVRANAALAIDSKNPNGAISASFRFFPIKRLEISYQDLGFVILYYRDNSGESELFSYLQNSTFGIRYNVAPIVNLFLDLNLPTKLFGEYGQMAYPRIPDRFSHFFKDINPYVGAQVVSKLKKKKIISRYGAEAGLAIGNFFSDYTIYSTAKLAGEVAFASPISELCLDFPIGASIEQAITTNGFSNSNFFFWAGIETNFSKEIFLSAKIKVDIMEDRYFYNDYTYTAQGSLLVEGTYNF